MRQFGHGIKDKTQKEGVWSYGYNDLCIAAVWFSVDVYCTYDVEGLT